MCLFIWGLSRYFSLFGFHCLLLMILKFDFLCIFTAWSWLGFFGLWFWSFINYVKVLAITSSNISSAPFFLSCFSGTLCVLDCKIIFHRSWMLTLFIWYFFPPWICIYINLSLVLFIVPLLPIHSAKSTERVFDHW